ncbi:MAG: sulfatase [Anaerolineae bacterium]|nr:sulfatase [Anaerolineae bacterium]
MTPTRPNILFIVLDTLRRDRLGTYGHKLPTSPRLDDFAAQATRFARAVAPAQWTIPSHASMFTGVYPREHQVAQSTSVLSGAYATAAELLQLGGYHTVGFCNNPLVGALDHGLQRGFAEFYNYASAVPQRPTDAQRSRLYREWMKRFQPFARRVGNQFAQRDWLFRVSLHPTWVPIWSKYINFKGNTVASIGDLVDYWGTYFAGGADQPLFAFLNLMQSHLPYQPPQQYLDRVAPDLRNDRRAYQFMSRFNADAAAWASPPDPPLEDWQEAVLNAFYDAEIASQDDQLGKLLDHLQKSGALDNTFVIIAADHGEGLGEHDLFGHSFAVHQELVHVPLIMRGADRVPVGGHVSENVSTRRIFHTLLDVAGIETGSPGNSVHERSLLNAVRGGDPETELAFTEAIPPRIFLHVLEHRNPAVIDRLRLRLTRRGVYQGDHKLMMAGDTPEALYDVAADPFETHNLVVEQPALAEKLAQTVAAFAPGLHSPETESAATREISEEVLEQLRALGYVD